MIQPLHPRTHTRQTVLVPIRSLSFNRLHTDTDPSIGSRVVWNTHTQGHPYGLTRSSKNLHTTNHSVSLALLGSETSRDPLHPLTNTCTHSFVQSFDHAHTYSHPRADNKQRRKVQHPSRHTHKQTTPNRVPPYCMTHLRTHHQYHWRQQQQQQENQQQKYHSICTSNKTTPPWCVRFFFVTNNLVLTPYRSAYPRATFAETSRTARTTLPLLLQIACLARQLRMLLLHCKILTTSFPEKLAVVCRSQRNRKPPRFYTTVMVMGHKLSVPIIPTNAHSRSRASLEHRTKKGATTRTK